MNTLNIVYTGKIYEGKQNPTKLFQAVLELISERYFKLGEIGIDFYGEELPSLKEDIERFCLVGTAKQHGIVPHEVALEKQRQARVLWLMRWEGEDGVIPGKIYEYMATGRPILATGGHRDEVTKIIEESHIGVGCDTVEQIKTFLTGF